MTLMKQIPWLPQAWSTATLARKVGAFLAVAGALLAGPSLRGHHGLAQFDTKHIVKRQGAVNDFQWINPHAYIYADMKDEKGKSANWKLELGSLGMLTRFGGWNRDTLKRGDQITVDGYLAKDGSPYMSLTLVTLSDGRVLSAAP